MNIPGAEELIKVFGRWPSFHDAEVVRLIFERADPGGGGPSIFADVHVFERTNEVGPDGFFVMKNHTLVSFRFAGVDEVALDGFNQQNVLSDLAVVDIRDRQLERLKYQVQFHSSFGMDARFLCRDVTLEGVRPWNASDENIDYPRQSGPRPGRYQPRS